MLSLVPMQSLATVIFIAESGFHVDLPKLIVARMSPASNLLGQNPFEQAQIDQWIETTFVDLTLPVSAWTYPILQKAPSNADVMQKARQDVQAFFGNLNKHLQTRTYLVGESVTLADIVAFSALVQPFSLVCVASEFILRGDLTPHVGFGPQVPRSLRERSTLVQHHRLSA